MALMSIEMNLLIELKHLARHLLLALITLCLPWALSFKLLRFLTRFGLGASDFDAQALKNMSSQGVKINKLVAIRQMRLHRLVDLADYYKSWYTTAGWLKRYWRVIGDPLPDPQQYPAVLFVTFHYGQGFWALRHFQKHGLSMAALYRPPPKPVCGDYFNYWFFWVRLRSIFRLTKTEPIRVGDDKSELTALVRRLVQQQQPVGVMPDIPTDPAHAVEVSLLGKRAYFASALLRLVVKKNIPVVLYTSVLDLQSGARNVDIKVLCQHSSVEELAQALASCLEAAIMNDATAWHLWPWAHEIIFD